MTKTAALTQQQQAAEQARENYDLFQTAFSPEGVWVAAEAKTGSRYVVTLHRLPAEAALRAGGQHLISLVQPWQANMVFTAFPGEEIHADYVVEKLCKDRTHGGDLMAVYLTVNEAVKEATKAGIL